MCVCVSACVRAPVILYLLISSLARTIVVTQAFDVANKTHMFAKKSKLKRIDPIVKQRNITGPTGKIRLAAFFTWCMA